MSDYDPWDMLANARLMVKQAKTTADLERAERSLSFWQAVCDWISK